MMLDVPGERDVGQVREPPGDVRGERVEPRRGVVLVVVLVAHLEPLDVQAERRRGWWCVRAKARVCSADEVVEVDLGGREHGAAG